MLDRLIFIILAVSYSAVPGVNGCTKPPVQYVEKSYEFTYKGCFIDRDDDRDFEKMVGFSRYLTRKECTERCEPEKTAFMGLQDGKACYCGDNYGKHGRVDDFYCSTPCAGDSREQCGGKLYNAVYTQGVVVE